MAVTAKVIEIAEVWGNWDLRLDNKTKIGLDVTELLVTVTPQVGDEVEIGDEIRAGVVSYVKLNGVLIVDRRQR